MNIAIYIYALEACLIIALIGAIVVRQIRGQYADRRSLWKAPVVLAAVGLAILPVTVTGFRPVDALLLAIEVIVCVLIGMGMGALTTASIVERADRRGRRVRIRSGWMGAALWIIFIAVRLGLRPVAAMTHAEFVTSTGVVLVLIAIARAVTARVVVPKIEAASTRMPAGLGTERSW